MKFSLLSIFFIIAVAGPIMGAMNCPDGTSPGTSFCVNCGCYCGSDNRVHCDENTSCPAGRANGHTQCMNGCKC